MTRSSSSLHSAAGRRCGSVGTCDQTEEVERCVSVSSWFKSMHGSKWRIMHEALCSNAFRQGDPRETRLRLEDTEISVVIHDCQSFTLHTSFFHSHSDHGALCAQQNIYTFISTGTKWVLIRTQMAICQILSGNSKDYNHNCGSQQAADEQFKLLQWQYRYMLDNCLHD